MIEALKARNASLQNVPMVYAGRLDPMADGVLIILSGKDRFEKETFLSLDKTYRATFLFGISSDSHDALGRLTEGSQPNLEVVESAISELIGTHSLPYPAYSSYKIQGKPLHWWASQNRLSEIDIPQKRMQVTSLSDIELRSLSVTDFQPELFHRIKSVSGDFRQNDILKDWEKILSSQKGFVSASVTLTVTSGTYIRSLAALLGAKLGCGALLLHLTREQVGSFTLHTAERLF
jgi:tRNA pseudouridine55 synthase